MAAKPLTSTLSVSAQVSPQDIADLAAAGFRSVICNRPDGEGPDQPTFAEIEAAARAAGLVAVHQPIVPGKLGVADAAAFADLVDRLPKPVLGYCRTGTRSATLWALSEAARGQPLLGIISTAGMIGYDVTAALAALRATEPAR